MNHQSADKNNPELTLKLLRSVVAEANDAVLITKADPIEAPDGPEIVYANHSFEKMTGYKAKEVIGKTPRILQGPNSESNQLEKLRRAIRNRESTSVEVLNYSKKGKEQWINISISPIFDGDKCTHFISIQRDITERKFKEIEEKLTTQISRIFSKEESVKKAIESSLSHIIKLKSFDAVEFWLVDKVEESIKLLSHKVGNRGIEDFYTEATHVKSFKKGEGLPGVTWEKKKNLFWRNLDSRKSFIRSTASAKSGLKTGLSIPILYHNEVLGVMVILLLEDLKKMPNYVHLFNEFSLQFASEISRKQLEEQLKKIYDMSPDIVSLINHQGCFKKINPAMIELLGYPEDEIIDEPFIKFVHPDDKNATEAVKESLYRGQPVYHYQNRYITKSGFVKWIEWTATPFPDEDLILAIGRDVTEQKSLKELLDQANQLAKIGSWELDLVNNEFYWSDVTRQIHEEEPGFKPTLKKSLIYYRDRVLRKRIKKEIEDAIEMGTSWDLELPIITAKGNERWVRAIGEAEIVDGKPIRIFGSFQDIHLRKVTELKLLDRSRHIDAIASLNSALLNYGDWFEALENQMEMIGEAVRADRVYYFENRFDPDTGEGFTSQKLEWCREGIKSQLDNPDLVEIPFQDVPELVGPMIQNRPSTASLSDVELGTTTRYVMEDEDIKTFLAIPITIKGEFFGFVGFDNCTEEVKWSDEDVRTLSAITTNLAVAIERNQAEKKLLGKTRQLDAIAHFNGLLIKEEDWLEALDQCLEIFCKVAAADRVYFFEHSILEETGQDVVSMRREWVRKGIKPEIDNPVHQNLTYDEIRSFIDEVIHGGGYNEIVSDIEDSEFAEFLKGQGIKSILAIPVFTGDDFRGFIGFDNCISERSWTEEEITFLKTIAINLGSAIENEDSEAALQNAYEEKNTILESIDDGFFTVTDEFRVTYWNHQAEQMLLTPKEEIVGKVLWDRFDINIAEVSFNNYKRALETREPVNFEDYYEPIGRWFDVNVYPSESGLSVFFKDITDRKRSEDRLQQLNISLEQQAKDLATSNAELEQFALVASHDLQEPLRMITGFLAQLERKYEDILDEKGKKYIHFATDGAKRMRRIIQDLLEYSRVGRFDAKREVVDLNNTLQDVTILQKKIIDEKGADITWEPLPTIKANRGAMQQLFQNLIHNALHYQNKGNKPEIKIWPIETDTHWKFYIKDNGIGIDPNFTEQIFTIFRRLHGRDEFSGTGLGLAICKKIVEEYGGTIGVDSAVGQGSTFVFTIAKKQRDIKNQENIRIR